ncbi:type II toxin-antitoxin system VapC family toxin [uncultured Nostoc sp.]|uniref:type II toxin-antitoxin system VapC family toxin n=1 Tax=uncultured Nostoc sp. TaxID=340711 RepID=UPI0035CB0317
MKLLLDTHIFLWFISGDQKLPIHLQNSIRDLNNDVNLSCVSVWEATVKYQLGKLPLPESPEIYLPKQRQQHLISSLNLDEESVAQLLKLPLLHRDPFDRMLICQALQHNLTIVTVDPAIRSYSVSVLY